MMRSTIDNIQLVLYLKIINQLSYHCIQKSIKHIHYIKEVKTQKSFTYNINIIQIILLIRQQIIQHISQISKVTLQENPGMNMH